MIGIYKIENLINGKVYIGQSINTSARWLAHKEVLSIPSHAYELKKPLYKDMNKYGIDNFKFEIIEECDKEKLNEREIYWIKKYNSYYFDDNSNGYNLTRGGETSINSYTEEEIQLIIDLWYSGKSVGQIVKETGKSNSVIIGYLKDRTDYTPEEGRIRGQLLSSHGEKQINQYNLQGEFIQTFPSQAAAGRAMGTDPSLIGKTVKGRFKQLNGYIYIRAIENQEEVLQRRLSKTKRKLKVEQIDIQTNNVIRTFNNTREAEQSVGGLQRDGTIVRGCCEGEYTTALGYKWRYKND
jgi:group I intron endonuclease